MDAGASARRCRAAGVLVVVLVFACSCAHVSRHQAEALQDVMEQASYVPSGPEDMSFIDPLLKGQKLVFLGEAPHHEEKLRQAVMRLAVHLREKTNYNIFGKEWPYCERPYFEAQSLGSKRPLDNVIPRGKRPGEPNLRPMIRELVAYNSTCAPDKKMMCTAIDMDHGVHHGQGSTVQYLGYLASRSSSREVQEKLRAILPELVGLKGRRAIHAYLDRVEHEFRAGWDTFSVEDRNEIEYTLEQERGSIDFHTARLRNELFNYQNSRGKYFRKNIERALQKAERSDGAVVCYVGATHAQLLGREWEAQIFRNQYPETRGRVLSILVEYPGGWYPPSGNSGALEAAALARMGTKDRIFVDLRHEAWAKVKDKPRTFFKNSEPFFDGVLFIKPDRSGTKP